MSTQIEIRSRVWPTAAGVMASLVGLIALLGLLLTGQIPSDWISILVYCATIIFFATITSVLALVLHRKISNPCLLVLKNDKATFLHNSWRNYSATLVRSQIASIDVDQSHSDNDGAFVIIRLHEDAPDVVAKSKVWNAYPSKNVLVYAYGDSRVSALALGVILNDWLNEKTRKWTRKEDILAQ